MQKKVHKKQNFLRLSINLDRVKLELSGDNTEKCLQEVNKILEKVMSIAQETDFPFENPVDQMLSDELILNSTMTKLVTSFSQIYDDYRTNRVAIENKKIVELEKGKVENQLDFNDVKKSVIKLLHHVRKEDVKHAIVHIKGAIKESETKKITDHINQELPHAQIHTLLTKSDVPSHTIVEGIFFGEFADEGEE
jgi:hypothetical protein